MEIIQGILQRIWCSCGLIILIGAFILMILWIEKDHNKNTAAAGCLCVLLGLCIGFWYTFGLLNPQEVTTTGEFQYAKKKTGVFPPAPLTSLYVFEDDRGESISVYMDSFTQKQLCPDGLEEGVTYRLTYESRTELILNLTE